MNKPIIATAGTIVAMAGVGMYTFSDLDKIDSLFGGFYQEHQNFRQAESEFSGFVAKYGRQYKT